MTTPSPISDQASGELLPCPFCGCSVFPSDLTGEGIRYTIKCQDCPGRMEFFSSDKEQAISAWNRRSTAPTTGSAPEQFPYQKTFDAIAAATSVCAGRVAISVIDFREAFDAAPASPAASVPDSALAEIYTAACEWTDDWAERQETTPTKQMNDAIFIRRVMALLAASMGGNKS